MHLRVSLFDHLRLAVAHGALPRAPRPRAQRLLAYLLLQRSRPLTREHIAFTLWPDSSEPHAFGTLRRALSDLRAALPSAEQNAWINVTDTTLNWNPNAPYWLDIDTFEQSIRERTPSTLHDAIDLYTGDLLAAWDDDWLVVERERLRQLQIDALRWLVAHYRGLGEYEAGLALARQALVHDPLSEATHRDLISLHYAAGDRGAALAAYERLSTVLDSELGIEPMAETQALRAAIAGGTAPQQTGTAVAAQPHHFSQQALPTLVGRDTELRTLAALWEDAQAGRGRSVTVSGDAGVGKSHLVRGLAEYVAAHGGLPLAGHCYEFEQALPFQAIVEMLRTAATLLRHADLSAAHRSVLARLAPDVLGAAGIPRPEADVLTTDPRTQLFEALWQGFLALSRSQPLLLVIEDTHWAAASTIDWLTYITPRLETASVLVVITYRTDEIEAGNSLARLTRRLARDARLATLSVAPLSPAAHRQLVAHLSGLSDDVVAPLADRLFAETAGNPFFLHEILRGLIETRRIFVSSGQWEGSFVEAAGRLELPLSDSARDLITARVERLQPESQTFLQVAAVAGRLFQYGDVQHATGWTDEPALHALEDVLARGLVSEQGDPGDFAFTHHLIQEVVYAGMTTPRRVFWHRRLAGAIQTLRPDDVEALAHHFNRAGDDEQARVYFVLAGDRAHQHAAMDDAARLYRAALDRWPDNDRAGRAELLYKRGQSQWVLGELHAALGTFEASSALFETLENRMRVGDIERMIGRLYWEQGNRQLSLDHYHRAIGLLEQEPESVELARAISAISQMHMLASEFDEAIDWGERALALAERLGAEDVAIHALTNIGNSLTGLDDLERGLALLHTSLDGALAAGLPHDAMRANFSLAEQYLSLGRYAEARQSYDGLLAYATRVHADWFTGIALRSLIQVMWWTGHWADALAYREQLFDWVRMSPRAHVAAVWASRVLGMIYNDLGQADLACEVLERDLAAARSAAELQTTVPHLAELARAYAALGRDSDAAGMIHELLDWVDRYAYVQSDCIMPVLVACRWFATSTDAVDLDAVQASVERLKRAAQQLGTVETQAALAEGTGMSWLASAAPIRAVEQLQNAVGGWESLGRPYDQARVLDALSYACRQAGQDDAARMAFDRALAIYDDLASQLVAPMLKASFLNVPQLRKLDTTRSQLDTLG